MNDDLQRHLDGEVQRDTLDDGARRQADAWERMLEAFRVDTPDGRAPAWLEQAVMADIEALPEPNPARRFYSWLTRPRDLRVSPLTGTLALAALVLLLMRPTDGLFDAGARSGSDTAEPGVIREASQSSDVNVVYVQFRLEAPAARSVSLAGDFTDWEASWNLEDSDGDGIWTARVPVTPGVHAYMFLVDGNEWATDPEANRYQDDGFGNRNAVLAVASSE